MLNDADERGTFVRLEDSWYDGRVWRADKDVKKLICELVLLNELTFHEPAKIHVSPQKRIRAILAAPDNKDCA